MTARTHISAEPIKRLRAVDVANPNHSYKPSGFWYEIDGDWREWCASEMPAWLKDKKLYRLDLNGENILRIANVIDFDQFDREYSIQTNKWDKAPDWRRVAEKYDGIEIAPYIYQRRLEAMWYYGWDCASGVLWRPKGASVTLLGEVPALATHAGDGSVG